MPAVGDPVAVQGVGELPGVRPDGAITLDPPATVRAECDFRVTMIVDRRVVIIARRQLGWRLYAANGLPAQLSMAQAVRSYRV